MGLPVANNSASWHCESVLAEMTVQEKASLLAGADDWHLRGVPRLGVSGLRVTDCGHGVTLCGELSSSATCLPTGVGMAATWNVELLERAGRVLGRECQALGCSILLGPKLNLHRHPMNGRNFETFSEDPWLAGLLGAAVIRGIQATGVGACVKAMAANNQQTDQEKISSEVDERTLREMYLRVFQIAVEEGDPCAIMTAYNRLNGEYCSESPWLIRQVIKEDWQFEGMVVSDWRSVHSERVYVSGLDLEMPGPGTWMSEGAVLQALREGLLTAQDLNDHAERILRVLEHCGGGTANPELLNSQENRAVALEVAEESIVLLKNDEETLPWDVQRLRRILVTGPNAAHARLGGGGSASVSPFYAVSPLEGIREICGDDVEVEFLEGCSLVGVMEPIHGVFTHRDAHGDVVAGLLAEYFSGFDVASSADAVRIVTEVDFSWGWAAPVSGIAREHFVVRFSGELTPLESGSHRLGLYAQEGCVRLKVGGEVVAESWDDAQNGNFEAGYSTRYFTIERSFEAGCPVDIEIEYAKRAARAAVRLEWEKVGGSDKLAVVEEAARQADAVIVCAGLSNLFEGGARDRLSDEIPEAQRELIERVAAVNPHTVVALNSGAVLTLPWETAVPAILQCWYPGQEGGRALARILFGQTNPSGCLPETLPRRLEDHASIQNYPGNGRSVCYEEGLFIGYRHFDHAGIQPHYPFGFGLSYTEFSFKAPRVDRCVVQAGESVCVRVRVRNTGTREGRVVAQCYVRALAPPVIRPEKELRAFQKILLAPGEEADITFLIGTRALERFDDADGTWHVDPGKYEILTGPHSGQLQGVPLEVLKHVPLPEPVPESADRDQERLTGAAG